MEDQKFSFKGITQKAKEYVQNYKDLAYLQVVEKVSRLVPSAVTGVITIVCLLFVIFYLSIALALFLGELFNSYALGFTVTGLLFLLVIVLIFVFGNSIKKKITDATIRVLLNNWNNDDDEAKN